MKDRLGENRMARALAVCGTSLLLCSAALADIDHDPHILPGLTSSAGTVLPGASLLPKFSLTVPAYSSLPSASAKIYLDFDGDITPVWKDYFPGTTPAYDQDADPSTFNQQELDGIHEVWSRVSEMYSPFNIDVTTVDPGNLNNFQTMRVVIGGDGKNGAATPWYAVGSITIAGGIAYTGGFYNDSPNTGFVFPGNLENGTPKYVAIAAAHEAGHGFGLGHQSAWDGSTIISEYNNGTADKAPIMGRAYFSTRALWYPGHDLGVLQLSNDLDVLSGVLAYREDDHGGSFLEATHLNIVGGATSASGVITETADRDFFRFSLLEESFVDFTVTGAPIGAMLDPSLRLVDSNGVILQTVATSNLTESLFAALLPGDYGIGVLSARGYGDIGQFFLSGTITAIPEPALALLIPAAMLLGRPRKG
jgi:hypothetical protein